MLRVGLTGGLGSGEKPLARILRSLSAFVIVGSVVSGNGQSLGDGLSAAGIPRNSFSSAELSQTINGVSNKRGGFVYLVYMRASKDQLLQAPPQIVRFDSRLNTVIRRELKTDEDDCCGSPDGIDFTERFLLISFHDNPSASIVFVVDHDLRLVESLYGFDFHEISPDQVVFIENMVHFAPQHLERLRVADLRTGKTEEVYPIKDDALRASFAGLHEKHMPSSLDCQQSNDPCDPNSFDETIAFIPRNQTGTFAIRVTRDGSHPWVTKDAVVEIPFQQAIYDFQRAKDGWRYCSRETVTNLIKGMNHTIPDATTPRCEPNLPVVADKRAAETKPFPPTVKKVK